MTEDERRAAGIFDTLRNRPGRLVWDDGPMPISIQDRIPADTVREDFFVSQILTADSGEGEVLVLLGNEHVMPVAEKLRLVGHSIRIRHELFPG